VELAINIDKLPNEVVAIILSYLGQQHQNIRRVCRQWFDLVNYSHFKLGLILNSEIDDFIKCFSRYNKPIGLTLHKDEDNSFLARRSVTKITTLTQLTYLDIVCDDKGIAFGRLTNLKSLKTKRITQHDLQQLTNLTKLELWRKIAIEYTDRRQLPTSLVSLRFPGYDAEENMSPSDRTQLKNLINQLPRVTKLFAYRGAESILKCTPNVQRLILQRYAVFPKNLFLTALYHLEAHSTSVPHAQQTTLTKLTTFDVDMREKWSIKCLTNLKELYMEYGWTTSISSLTDLRSLNIKWADTDKLISSIRFPEKFTKLRVGSPSDIHVDLSAFTNLVELRLTGHYANTAFVASFYQLTRLAIRSPWQHTYLNSLTKLEDLSVTLQTKGDFPPYDLDLRALTRLKNLQLSVEKVDLLTSINLNAPQMENLTVLYYVWNKILLVPLTVHGCNTLTRVTSLVGHFANPLLNFTDLLQLTALKQLKAWIPEGEDLSLLTRLRKLTSLHINSFIKQDLVGPTTLQHLELTLDEEDRQARQDYIARLRRKLPLLTKLGCYTK
jgi:hypothetical protein